MIFLALMLAIPFDDVIRDECDLIELNHCYDEKAEKRFDQVIFWEWDCDRSTHRVVDFRMNVSVRIDRIGDDWRVRFADGETRREVRATSYRETWTQYDPERDDLKWWSMQCRRKLRKRT